MIEHNRNRSISKEIFKSLTSLESLYEDEYRNITIDFERIFVFIAEAISDIYATSIVSTRANLYLKLF